MGESSRKSCKCRNKIDNRPLAENKFPPVQICFLTLLEPGNTLDPTRPGFVVVDWKDVQLGPVQKKCKVRDRCKRNCEEQESATLKGYLHWTVSIPIFSSCAAMGSNTGFQSVSGVKIINQEICGDLSRFNPCNIQMRVVEIKVQPNPCPSGTNLGTLVGGIVANPPDQCDCIFPNGSRVTIPNEFGNCQDSCDNLVFNEGNEG